MTFRVCMRTYVIFLANAKKSLDSMTEESSIYNDNILYGTNVIISCVGCIETFVNQLFQSYTNLNCYDQLRLAGKIETLYNLRSKTVDWRSNPYQMFQKIIGIRNWLIHFKDEDIGLLNSRGKWIKDNVNVLPKKDPYIIFTKDNCQKYYNETRKIIIDLSEMMNIDEYMYKWVKEETFDYFEMG
ncbi:hypothetical protein [Clostridium estertheticum]|uniref:hypothetical protein n=1 Tax=Clostridium estertheticum TaxID=238834 RepID=UPI001C0E0AE3|nr:hypothetical protein [Clostridium estertheticum]MBU3183251.1 hypothetical protein [Clostridium estertheticum]